MYTNLSRPSLNEYIAATIIQSRFRGNKNRSRYKYKRHWKFIHNLWMRREEYINNSPLERLEAIEQWNNLNNNINAPILVSRQHAQTI